MENKNIELVKGLLDKFLAGDGAGYIEGCHEEFYGKVFSGLIPGGEEIKGKEEFNKNVWSYAGICRYEKI